MDVSKALQQRHCSRAFLENEIPTSILRQAIELASRSPSSKNTQPWQLHHLKGQELNSLKQDYLKAFDTQEPIHPPYSYSPHPMPEDWKSLAREVGFSLFAHKGIAREDKEKRHHHNRENFAFFDAPHLFILSTNKEAESGTFFDCGLFFSSLLLCLEELGIQSCPMFSAVSFPHILEKHIPSLENQLCITGLVCGYESQVHVNEFRTTRQPLDKFVFGL